MTNLREELEALWQRHVEKVDPCWTRAEQTAHDRGLPDRVLAGGFLALSEPLVVFDALAAGTRRRNNVVRNWIVRALEEEERE